MNTKKIKVLIVDDSHIVLDRLSVIITEMLSVNPVLISKSFNEAVDLINVELPDVILLDIQLPGKNGIELLAFVKSNYPNIKIIIVTNRASAYYKDLCDQMGANSFVDKSKEFEKIPGIIETLCCINSCETNIRLTH
ncbi:MAG: response regulator transcription factor [Rhizobacter sp.]|nr:response regulator transcription factor [Ferruginibacter sp.]